MQNTPTNNSKNDKMPFIFAIVFLMILLIISFVINLLKCDDLRGRITLGELYNDFKGNKDPNARMTAKVDISTAEGACNFDVFYEYDSYRVVDSNYITPPLSAAEESEINERFEEIKRDIGNIDEMGRETYLKALTEEIEGEYDIEANLLKDLEPDEILERIFEKYQNDKDICKRYQYPFDDVGAQSKQFLSRLLDDDYLDRRGK